MNRRSFLLSLAAPAAGPLLAHWPLDADARDASGNNLHGTAYGVRFTGRGAEFDGRSSRIEVPSSPALEFGTRDFTIAAEVELEADLDDLAGGILMKYDPARRRGLVLAMRESSVTTAQANFRNLHFGIDDGRGGENWADEGRPGRSVFTMALAVHRGELYAGTCEPGEGEAGRVWRWAGKGRWIDCGSPDRSNAVSALASYKGHLYAGTAKYRLAGSALPESPNPHLGGRIYRLEDDGSWRDCGRIGESTAVACLTVFQGRLYASSLYAPAGTYRYEGGDRWAPCGTPQGLRVVAMGVFDGHLYGTGYDKGHVYRYREGAGWEIAGELPDTTQTYGFAVYRRQLYVSTWPSATVFRYEGDRRWTPVGRPGEEKESMALAVYNGKLYVGTLPNAEVHRYEGEGRWRRLAQLDSTPEVRYRRAWSMAVFRGRLFCGTLPSGRVWSMEAGRNATWDHELAPGRRHVAAVRAGGRLRLYLDGAEVARSEPFSRSDFDLTNREPLVIGSGDQDVLRGRLRDVRLYGRALRPSEIAALARGR